MPKLRIQWRPAADVDASEQALWTALADRAAEPNPFLRPEFVLPAAEERAPEIELLVVRDEARWLACLPVRRTRRWRHLPLPALDRWSPEYGYCATPLVDRDAIAPAVEGLFAALAAERRGSFLVLDQIPPDGPVGRAITAEAGRRGVRPVVFWDFQRAAWFRRAPEEDLEAQPGPAISRRSLSRLRSQGRQLGRELGGELEVVDVSADPAAWDEFLALENSGWKAERGAPVGAAPEDAAFFRAMCARMNATGRLELLSMRCAGRTVAMECHLVDEACLYSFKIAYDPALHDYSPGAVMQSRMIERFARDGLRLADACSDPENAAMNRMWPDRRRLQILLLPTGAPSARLLRPALAALTGGRVTRDRVVNPLRARLNRGG